MQPLKARTNKLQYMHMLVYKYWHTQIMAGRHLRTHTLNESNVVSIMHSCKAWGCIILREYHRACTVLLNYCVCRQSSHYLCVCARIRGCVAEVCVGGGAWLMCEWMKLVGLGCKMVEVKSEGIGCMVNFTWSCCNVTLKQYSLMFEFLIVLCCLSDDTDEEQNV